MNGEAFTTTAIPVPDKKTSRHDRRRRSRRHLAGATAGLRSAAWLAGSLVLLLAFWAAISALVGKDVLPGPVESIAAVGESWRDGFLWSDIGITAVRIAGAFAISLAVSIIAGVALGSSRLAEGLFGPWVTIGASVPSLVFIVVIYLAVGVTDRAAMLGTACVVAPMMTYAVWDGMRALDPTQQEMARAFRAPRLMILRRVVLPQTAPFIFTAARTGLSLTWRIMIFVELLGCSSGVGYRIQYFYNLVDMKRVIAAALPFVVLMLAFEFGIVRPFERRIFRWRPEQAR